MTDTLERDAIEDPYEVLPRIVVRRRIAGRAKKCFLALLAVVMFVVCVYAIREWRYLERVNPAGDPLAAQLFEVTDTDDLRSVSERLAGLGFVVDASTFRTYVANEGGLDVVRGFYTLKPRDHMGNILRVLRTPPNQTFMKVTFPEGFTLAQIADRLATGVPGFDAAALIARATTDLDPFESEYLPSGSPSLEGLLFPDTYSVAGDVKPVQILQRMVRLMERVGRQEGLDDSSASLGYTSYQVLTIASMIEREARTAADRPKIARVIYNRLALGMPLEIDATLYYGQDPTIDFSALKTIDSPYNTYLYTGLPPTPIANPGRASIRAALAPSPNPSTNNEVCAEIPADSPCLWLYYVLADEDGSHVFAATFDQHQRNVEAARAAGLL